MTSPALMEVCRKVKKNKSIEKRKLRLNSLPHDLIVELTAVIAASSATPLDDIKSLRATCKCFLNASKEGAVGRRMAVEKEASLRWWNKREYLALLRHCELCGNPQACFLLALDEIYNQGEVEVGMRRLERAVEGGCTMAEYLMGIIRFSEPATKAIGMELLEKVAGCSPESAATSGDPGVVACRKNVAVAVRETTMRRWTSVMRGGEAAPTCGRGVGNCGEVAKHEWAEERRRFCCRACRWNHEFRKFLSCL